jgi:serine/threonine protein kinase
MTTRHTLLRLISETSESKVWQAQHADTGALIAVKLLLRPPPPAEIMRLRHPHILPAFEITADTLTMPWVEGISLAEKRPSTFEDALTLIRQTLNGLIAIHEAGLLHLDLKPENLLHTAAGWLITDWGCAQLLAAARANLHGSVHCMAPENFEAGSLDERADLYSLGCTYHFAFTGSYPFEGELTPQVITAHLQHRAAQPPAKLSSAMQAWLSSLTLRQPSQRPSSARSALASFEACQL